MEEPNINYIVELADGDNEFKQKFISILQEELPAEKNEYISIVEQKDYQSASSLVHKIKHKISVLGMTDSHKLAVAHEEELKVNDLSNSKEFIRILDTMEKFLNTLT